MTREPTSGGSSDEACLRELGVDARLWTRLIEIVPRPRLREITRLLTDVHRAVELLHERNNDEKRIYRRRTVYPGAVTGELEELRRRLRQLLKATDAFVECMRPKMSPFRDDEVRFWPKVNTLFEEVYGYYLLTSPILDFAFEMKPLLSNAIDQLTYRRNAGRKPESTIRLSNVRVRPVPRRRLEKILRDRILQGAPDSSRATHRAARVLAGSLLDCITRHAKEATAGS